MGQNGPPCSYTYTYIFMVALNEDNILALHISTFSLRYCFFTCWLENISTDVLKCCGLEALSLLCLIDKSGLFLGGDRIHFLQGTLPQKWEEDFLSCRSLWSLRDCIKVQIEEQEQFCIILSTLTSYYFYR